MAMYSVAVVGAGMIGSSAAAHASLLCPSVVLVGGGEDGLPGAWADQGRITRVFDSRPAWRELATQSIRRYRSLEQESGVRLFTEVGYLTLVCPDTTDTGAFEESAEAVRREGFACTRVTEGAAYPYLRLPEGAWGFSQPDHAGHLNPRALVEAQQVVAAARGCSRLREEVVRVEREEEGHFTLHLSSGTSITAGQVLLATGAFLNLSNHLKPFTEQEVALHLTTQTVSRMMTLTTSLKLLCYKH